MKRMLLVLLLSGCALTSKATPADIRYFTPESAVAEHAKPVRSGAPMVRLGRITSSANLRARIVSRESTWEVREYETLRWTENPEMYVRRSLVRALFDDGNLERAMSGAAPTLDIEVIGFEEIHMRDRHAGRVELRYDLHDEQTSLASGTIAIERNASASIESVIEAIGTAMNDASSELDRVVCARLQSDQGIQATRGQ